MVSIDVQQSLGFLIFVTTGLLIIISVFLIKLLIDLSSLSKSAESLISIVKHDLGPTLKEFKRALININAITNSTSDQFKGLSTVLNEGLNIISHSTKNLPSKAMIIFSSLKQGVLMGLKAFTEGKKDRY